MIDYRQGDILAADAEALVNTVNCVGVMGRGIALQFKNAFPENFKAYAAACKRQEVQPGRMFVFETGALTSPRYIVNFPTKRHWRGKSRIKDVEDGLRALVDVIRGHGIRSIAVPPLGSGLGGLAWSDVRPRIESALRDLHDVEVVVFEPSDSQEPRTLAASRAIPRMTPGRAALVGLMHRYLSGLLDPSVTLLEVHKLMYFMQEAGQPLTLNYAKRFYGPYAEKLRHVLRAVEGHLIVGYRDGGDEPTKELQLVPRAVEDAEAFLATEHETRQRFERVAALVDGFETAFGLELLATVHWVVSKEQAHGPDAVVEAVYAWNPRKKQFSQRQIHLALDVLRSRGWLSSEQVAAGR